MTAAMVATLVAVTVVWGLNFAVIKTGIHLVPPIAFVALRFAAVGLCLIPWLRWPGRRMTDLIALSVVLGVVHFSLMFTGMKALDVATASIAIQLQVPFAAILAAVFFGEKLRWRRITGMAIAFAGVVMIAGEPRLAGNLPSLFMVVGAACTWAAANIQIKRIGDEVDVLALNGWVSLLAAPQLMALSWAVEDGQLAAIAALARDYAPIDDVRGTGANRKLSAANLLRRFWLEAGAGAPPATDVMAREMVEP